MKKILFGMSLIFLSVLGKSQGLQNLVVEKYYVSNAADSNGSAGVLPAGSVTYRFYAQMAPKYKFKTAYGNANHELHFTTTTSFFNNTDYGSATPGVSATNDRKNSSMLDSWITAGGAAAGQWGVLKTEDVNGSIGNANGILQNTDAKAGIPIKIQDGMMPHPFTASTDVAIVGSASSQAGVLGDGSTNGNSFVITGAGGGGGWGSLAGVKGITSTNMVLIAQITTNGILDYKLNIQIQDTTTGTGYNFVADNAQGSEIALASLKGVLGAPNKLPVVSLTSPTTGATYVAGDTVHMIAAAHDSDGTITGITFKVDGVSVGSSVTASSNVTVSQIWVSTVGPHSLTAVATDNDGGSKTSSIVSITVNPNTPPTVSVTAPTNAASFNLAAGHSDTLITITTNPADVDGSVAKVEFYVNGTKVGQANSNPWQFAYRFIEGPAAITAKATDNKGAFTISSAVNITVVDVTGGPWTISTLTKTCAASTFSMPLVRTKDSIANCIGFDVVMHYNKLKVKPTGRVYISKDMINTNYASYNTNIIGDSVIKVAIYLNSNATAGTFFTYVPGATKQLCAIEFDKTSGFANIDTAIFSMDRIIESYYGAPIKTKAVKNGKYITYKDTTFAGKLAFWYDNSPIKYNSANAAEYLISNITDSASTVTAHPDTTGAFKYNVKKGAKIIITRDIDNATDVMAVINGCLGLLNMPKD